MEEVLSTLLIIGCGLFAVRWLVNWRLLNLKNGTSFSLFRTDYSLREFFQMFKHMAISEWKLWWFDLQDQRALKVISNTLSVTIYLFFIGLIIIYAIEF